MRSKMLVGATFLWAAVLLASDTFQPLNVKTGLWETTMTSTATGQPPLPPDLQAKLARMPPEQRAKMEAMLKDRFGGTPQTRTYKNCITKEDLAKDPFSDPEQKCAWTILTSTGSELEARGSSCEAGKNYGMKTDVHVKMQTLDSEKVKGWGQIIMDGNGSPTKMDFTLTSRWLGASCPAGAE